MYHVSIATNLCTTLWAKALVFDICTVPDIAAIVNILKSSVREIHFTLYK